MTRVLYIDHPEADYLSAQLYFGLCSLLGPANVIDWPLKRSFHGETHRYPNVYDAPAPAASPERAWGDPGSGAIGSTDPYVWFPAQPDHGWTRRDVVERLGEFSLVVLASPRKWNSQALRELIATVGRERLSPLVMVDGEDYEPIRWDLAAEFWPNVYFKRELVASPHVMWPVEKSLVEAHVRVLPLPLAPMRILPSSDPRSGSHNPLAQRLDIDVYMPGGDNTPGGMDQWKDAVRRADPRGCLFGVVPFDQYLETASRCRIAVAVRGHSQDSLRSWELLAVEGPLVMVQRHTLVRPYPFVEGEHVVEFGSPEELESKLRIFLDDKSPRATIAAAGHAHLKAHHTPPERARYFLRESGVNIPGVT